MNFFHLFLENFTNLLSWFLMIVGLLFCITGAMGMFRMPDLFSKQHASGLIDTLGFLSISCSLALRSGISPTSLKVILMSMIATFLSAPMCNTLIKAAVINKILPKNLNKE